MKQSKLLFLMIISGLIGGTISFLLFSYTGKNGGKSIVNYQLGKGKNNVTIKNITLPSFDFSGVSEYIMPTVVHITTVINPGNNQNSYNPFDFFGFFNPHDFMQPQVGTGSGVIISEDGYIVTNNHVIDQADEIEVVLHDKRSFKAKVVGRDLNTDLAIIKISASKLDFIKFGNSDDLKVGEWVLALGNPFNLNSTITAGIVSAKARSLDLLRKEYSVESFIQTDAAVNPGNSGGALVNVRGELIGINTAIASKSGQYEGYAFAIPSNLVKKVVDDILKFGKVQRGFLGVRISEVTEEIAEKNKMNDLYGVVVNEVVKGGAAQTGGIRSNDIITSINGTKIKSVPQLQELVSRNRPGDKVKIGFIRNGKSFEATVVLKDNQGNTTTTNDQFSDIKDKIGAELQTASGKELLRLGLKTGVIVTALNDGAFRNAGISEGFIITKVDRQSVSNPDQLYTILSKSKEAVLIEGYYQNGIKSYYGLSLQD